MKQRGVLKGYQFHQFAEIHFHQQEIGHTPKKVMEVMDDKVLRGIMISLLHGGHYEILADLGALKVSEVNFYPS